MLATRKSDRTKNTISTAIIAVSVVLIIGLLVWNKWGGANNDNISTKSKIEAILDLIIKNNLGSAQNLQNLDPSILNSKKFSELNDVTVENTDNLPVGKKNPFQPEGQPTEPAVADGE